MLKAAKILTASCRDYYPFGMEMAGRSYEAGDYRFGFNGKEADPEAVEAGSQYDYGFRIYNTAIGRFLSVDPLTTSYPWYTPYQFAGNTPIWAIDLEGLEPAIVSVGYNTHIVFGNERTVSAVNHHKGLLRNVNWNSYAAADIFEVESKLNAITAQGIAVQCVYIQTHGNGGKVVLVNDMNSIDAYVGIDDFTVTASTVQLYLLYKTLPSEDEKRSFLADNPSLDVQLDIISSLENVMQHIEDGGALIIGGCYSGNCDEGQDDLNSALMSLSNDRITIISNQDGTRVNKNDENFLDVPLTEAHEFTKGWKRNDTPKPKKNLTLNASSDEKLSFN